jgi:hypothetical protein
LSGFSVGCGKFAGDNGVCSIGGGIDGVIDELIIIISQGKWVNGIGVGMVVDFQRRRSQGQRYRNSF